MGERIEVATFDGLFDAVEEAALYSINHRKWCWNHRWIHAALDWRYGQPDKPPWRNIMLFEGWNGPQGGKMGQVAEFCKRCKHIRCVHWFEKGKSYAKGDAYVKQVIWVVKCKFCGVRLRKGGGMEYNASNAARDLCAEIMPGWGALSGGRYGSGYYCELPVQVARVLDNKGELAARAYLEQVKQQGHIEMEL